MVNDYDVTIRIEETEHGLYHARVPGAPESHFATCHDPMVALRGALAVSRDAIDSTVEYDRNVEPDGIAE